MLMRIRTLRRQCVLVSMEDWDVLRFQGVLMGVELWRISSVQ